jgi:sodium/bile acid cotransporter 7
VDVRKKEEMRVSMLPGAISEKEYTENRERFDDHVVVAYCTIGYRSGMFAEKMAGSRHPGDRVYNLRGGLLAWVLDGGKVYDGKGASRRIHVYGKRWNYPPDGYESVW